jgi:hypothetical protein
VRHAVRRFSRDPQSSRPVRRRFQPVDEAVVPCPIRPASKSATLIPAAAKA